MDTRTPALTAGIYAMSDRRRRELKDIGKENLPIGLAIISRKYQLSRPSRCAVRGSLVASFRARSLPAIKKKKNSAGGNEKHPQGRKSP